MAILTGQTGDAGDFKQQADRDTVTPANDENKAVLLEDSGTIHPQFNGLTGVILPFAGSAAPADWLLCNGQAVSRTTYDVLYNIIGVKYGIGDGTTTFNIPNLKGKVPVGVDSTIADFNDRGKTGGSKEHTLSMAEMPSHDHPVNENILNDNSPLLASNNAIAREGAIANTNSGWNKQGNLGTSSRGSDAPHENMPPYVAVNYIIGT